IVRKWVLLSVFIIIVIFAAIILRLGRGDLSLHTGECIRLQSLALTPEEIAIAGRERSALFEKMLATHAAYMSVDIGNNATMRRFVEPYQNLYSRRVLDVTVLRNIATVILGPSSRTFLGSQPTPPYSVTWAILFARSHGVNSTTCAVIRFLDSSGRPVLDESKRGEETCCGGGF